MKRPILIHPDPRLKKACAPVPDLSDKLRVLADDMLETMYDAPGIGLAAPQPPQRRHATSTSTYGRGARRGAAGRRPSRATRW